MKKVFFTLVLCFMVFFLGMPGHSLAASSLKIAVASPPSTMNPHGSDVDPNLSIMANIFDGLLERKGAEGKLVPALAERYEHPDALTWKFYLRKGVKFHNGNPFTAADVKFTYERLSNPKVSEFTNAGKSLASIDIIDDYTVVIKTKTPTPWFGNNTYQLFIMDKESTENRDHGNINLKPIGTGAYKFVEWVRGSYLKLAANEDYWGEVPTIKKIEVNPVTEASTRFAALVSGQADMISAVPVELLDQIINDPKFNVIRIPTRRSMHLALGNRPGTPTADLRVRKAMYLAINEEEIIEKIMRGHAILSSQLPDSAMTGYNPSLKHLSYDPVMAKKLLKEAGYENGFEITLTGPNDRYVQDDNIAQAVSRYLAKVGIKVTLDVKPKSIFFPEVTGGKLDFYLIGWADATYDVGRTFLKLFHTRDDEKGYGGWNGTRYSDKELDSLFEEAFAIIDMKKREQFLINVNKRFMEKIAIIPLHYQEGIYAVKKGKVEFQPRPDTWIVFKEITVD